MQLTWPNIKSGAKGWTAIDASQDGALVAASVRCASRSPARPQVVKCARSSASSSELVSLAELGGMMGMAGFPWTMPLQRGDYQMMVVAAPPVTSAEMERSLRWSLSSMVDFPIDEANVAWMHIPTAEFQPNRARHIYAIVSRKTLLEEKAALFQKARLNLAAIDVRETAQRNIAALLEKKGEGLGLLSVGSTGVTITFTFDGELYLDRFIDLPLQEVVSADVSGREKIFERIALQVSRSVDFISRNFSFMPVKRIVLAPLPAPIKLLDYLVQNLPVQVEMLDLASVFDISMTPELREPENQAHYFVVLGAALRGTGKMP